MTPLQQDFTLKVPDSVADTLKNLHPAIKAQIRSGLKTILTRPYIGKTLKDELHGLRSYRVKRYRIIYRIAADDHYLEIITVGPRRNIYQETFRILKKSSQIDTHG